MIGDVGGKISVAAVGFLQRAIDIVAFDAGSEQSRQERFAKLPGQGPREAAQAENKISIRDYLDSRPIHAELEAIHRAPARDWTVARLARETGRSRGFAFVSMATEEGARKAIEQMNGAMLDSLRAVDWAPRSGRKLRRRIDAEISRLRKQNQILTNQVAQWRSSLMQVVSENESNAQRLALDRDGADAAPRPAPVELLVLGVPAFGLVVALPKDGAYFVTLIDAHDLGGANFGYRLLVKGE